MSFGRMGARYGRMGASGAVAVERPTAPVLSLDGVVGGTVTFDFVVDETIGEGDGRQLQVQADGGDWSTLLVDDTGSISSGEDAADEIEEDVSAFSAGDYDARLRVREGSDGPWSDWSNVVDFEVENTAPSYVYRGGDESDVMGHVHTFSVDVGDASFVLIAATPQVDDPDPISVTYDGHALSKIASVIDAGNVPCFFYAGTITPGTGSRNAVVTWTSASYEAKGMAVWSLHNLASTTVKASGTFTGTQTVTADQGDLVFHASKAFNSDSTLWDACSPTPASSRLIGTLFKLAAADWVASGNVSIELSGPYAGVYVVYA
jgi:hypothetical protein